MSTPTLSELLAQQSALAVALAAHEKPQIEAAIAALSAPGAQDLLAAVQAAQAELPDGAAKVQLGNVVTVLTAVPQVLAQELSRVTALLPQSPAPEGE